MNIGKSRHILLLSTDSLRVWKWHAGTSVLLLSCPNNEEGQATFTAFLQATPASLCYLLADVPEEDYRPETLPFVRGKDRQVLISRRLSQHFYGTPFVLSQSLGRESDGRRDENFLFSALTRPETFTPWLEILKSSPHSLVGLFSTAQLLHEIIPGNLLDIGRFVVITLGVGGLRQTYFDKGQLRFSRLSTITGNSFSQLGEVVGEETEKIHQYLIGQRLLSRGQSIPVFCLTDAEDWLNLQGRLSSLQELDFQHLPLQGISDQGCLEGFEQRIVSLLGRKPPSDQFLPESERRNYRLWQANLCLRLASVVTASLALAFSAWMLGRAIFDQQDRDDANAKAALARQHYQSLLTSLPVIATSPENLRSFIELEKSLLPQRQAANTDITTLSHVLEQFPALALQRLSWRLAILPDDSQASVNPGLGPKYLILELEARFPANMADDRRAQSEQIDLLSATLKEKLKLEGVRILSRPFDTDSNKSLKAKQDVVAESALNFSLRMWHPLTSGVQP